MRVLGVKDWGGGLILTWVGCKRNDLVSMSPSQLLREDNIRLLNENEQ